jgi:hypothetical protein
VGHPISSGSDQIDYSILSQQMFYPSYIAQMSKSSLLMDEEIVYHCLITAVEAIDSSSKGLTASYPEHCMFPSTNISSKTQHSASRPLYAEQVIAMDSLAYHMNDSVEYLDEALRFDPLQVSSAFDDQTCICTCFMIYS